MLLISLQGRIPQLVLIVHCDVGRLLTPPSARFGQKSSKALFPRGRQRRASGRGRGGRDAQTSTGSQGTGFICITAIGEADVPDLPYMVVGGSCPPSLPSTSPPLRALHFNHLRPPCVCARQAGERHGRSFRRLGLAQRRRRRMGGHRFNGSTAAQGHIRSGLVRAPVAALGRG